MPPEDATSRLLTRRQALTGLGAVGALALAGCNSSGTTTRRSGSNRTSSTTGGSTSGDLSGCVLIPEETEGPYPLDLSGDQQYFRQDITEGKAGTPLDLTLTLLNVSDGCSPLANARVDVWHCDKDGVYSGFSQPGSNTRGETFCRGIQLSDSSGKVTFKTIYPGWYAGRITHVHFQVFLNNGRAATSQIAFPRDVTESVYSSSLYEGRGQNTSVRSFADDNVFSDGTRHQMLSLTSKSSGYDGALTVGIAA